MNKDTWMCIGIIYGSIEIIMFTFTYQFPVITSLIIEKIIRLILGKKSCILGYHYWEYKTKTYKIEGIKHVEEVEVYERHCTGKCDQHQYSFCYPDSNLFQGWSTGELESPLKFERA